jgi:hypothetical protein
LWSIQDREIHSLNSGQIAANLSVAYHYVGNYSKRDQYYREAMRLGYNDLEKLRNIFEGKSSLQ